MHDDQEQIVSLRESLSPSQRTTPLHCTIDPGFVNRRLCETFLGPAGMKVVDGLIAQLPALADWERAVRIDHIYTHVMLMACRGLGVPTLEALLEQGRGRIFCSTEKFAPCRGLYKTSRAVSVWVPRRKAAYRVEFHYSTQHIASDTLRSHLRRGETLSVIARVRGLQGNTLVCEPYVMGGPWLARDEEDPTFAIEWFATEYFENFVEDLDEFAEVERVPRPENSEPMRYVSEAAFKQAMAKILGGAIQGDWGGETSDFYSAHVHLKGHRTTAAFVFKGPARFSPMNLNHLGKNGTQIFRLSQEPAQLLVVQHCHEILPPVRDTLRAFAVQPGRPRRYMLMDGRDSLRLLQAYDLYDWAVQQSPELHRSRGKLRRATRQQAASRQQ